MPKRFKGEASLDLFASLFVDEIVIDGEPVEEATGRAASEPATKPFFEEPVALPAPETTQQQAVPSNGNPAKAEQSVPRTAPPDAAERKRALDPKTSFLVQAPAGSGKTHLLTQRFLRLLSEANQPEEILAITFTNAAAAEMRNRILAVLEQAQVEVDASDAHARPPIIDPDPDNLEALAHKALARARLLDWQLLDQPAQLRITTIDAFCRSLALQCPLNWGLLSGLGGRLEPAKNPANLYRRAASQMMDRLLREDHPKEQSARQSMEALLLWRDNNWQDVEGLIVDMLGSRNRWYREFVFLRDPDWVSLRKRLEAPLRRASRQKLERLGRKLDNVIGSREEALALARFACLTPGKSSPVSLAARAEFPSLLAHEVDEEDLLLLEDAAEAFRDLACFLLTNDCNWRKSLDKHLGFLPGPAGRSGKENFRRLADKWGAEPGLLNALSACKASLPTRYTDDEWELIRHCFAVLRAAAVELQLIFAETGSVDFTEVSQIALRVLAPENGFPSDFAIRQADGIHHLLVDEFQDTSRNQHQLLSRLIAAWPDREGRSCFCVGDPMQSIYGFRDAEVELFERLKTHGLEMESSETPFLFEFLALRANFRTVPSLIEDLNLHFEAVFSPNSSGSSGEDDSGVSFSPAIAARPVPASISGSTAPPAKAEFHFAFTLKKAMPKTPGLGSNDPALLGDPTRTREEQLAEIVALVRGKMDQASASIRVHGQLDHSTPEKYRIAILARTKKSLILIADALRKAKISYRAIELVPLGQRQEVLDALAMTRALLNPADRTAWLAVLRAPWCGLSLKELHLLTSADDRNITAAAIPGLLHSQPESASRLKQLHAEGLIDSRAIQAVSRVRSVFEWASANRSLASSVTLGTWLESVWRALGADDTVNEEARANVRLLWAAIDRLPQGEVDLLGTALPGMLKDLCALPDPAASSTFGVQLMTIHKSKGLEFEAVIVPDLEAEGARYNRTLVSWLERGLSDSDSEEVTEFLIGPIQSKGDKAGPAKNWVDKVKQEREAQELKRLLYVAATRAREELHFFARPRFSLKQGTPELDKPCGLLKTSQAAFWPEVETQFDRWRERIAPDSSHESPVAAMAASANEHAESSSETNLVVMNNPIPENGVPRPARPTLLRRLPENYIAPEPLQLIGYAGSQVGTYRSEPELDPKRFPDLPQNPSRKQPLFARTEGSLEARLEGVAIHAFLEQLSLLRQAPGREGEPAAAAKKLAGFLPSVAARLRSHGLSLPVARKLGADALSVAQRSSIDPVGTWIFAPYAEAQTEAAWTGIFDGEARNIRADRVFLAPLPAFLNSPDSVGIAHEANGSNREKSGPVWWVIDYKSTYASGIDLSNPVARSAFLLLERETFSSQLTAYAQVLRKLVLSKKQAAKDLGSLPESVPVQAGIYYPRLGILDAWPV